MPQEEMGKGQLEPPAHMCRAQPGMSRVCDPGSGVAWSCRFRAWSGAEGLLLGPEEANLRLKVWFQATVTERSPVPSQRV